MTAADDSGIGEGETEIIKITNYKKRRESSAE